jgi:hypothetical protein
MMTLLRRGAIAVLFCSRLFFGVDSVLAQSSTPEHLRQEAPSEAINGILPNASVVSASVAAQQCLELLSCRPTIDSRDLMVLPS